MASLKVFIAYQDKVKLLKIKASSYKVKIILSSDLRDCEANTTLTTKHFLSFVVEKKKKRFPYCGACQKGL